MRVFLRTALLASLGLLLNACVTQLVTTPTQVAAQTAAQTAGQAAQVAIPDGDDENKAKGLQSNADFSSQSNAGFLQSEVAAVQSYRLDKRPDVKADVKKSLRSSR